MIDRRFSIAGAGCVVTGTLVSRSPASGTKLWLHGQEVRVLSLQRASSEVAEVHAGQRCALNLGGAVSADQPQRGDWLSEQVLPLSDRLDVCLTQLPTAIGTAACCSCIWARRFIRSGWCCWMTRPVWRN
ncbi:hypothetical protein ULG90_00135 [Halopseudomonas pachastrellae]|nr:hypothetical protein ULG90_00135 [Halopseudomonas pachastrellae]